MSEGTGRGSGTRAGGADDQPTRQTRAVPPAGQTAPGSKPPATTAGGANEDTAVRPQLLGRIQAKLAAATEEHRANAAARSEHTAATSSQAGRPSQARTGGGGRAPRRARLRMTRIDPWSVMKTSFLLAVAFGVVTVVAVAMIWSVLDAAGVWDSLNAAIQQSVGGPETSDLDVENYIGTGRVLGFTVVVAAIDVILITAIATLTAFLYNMSAALLGGVEVTLSEDQH